MFRRSGASSIAANPVLIGAATTLVVVVAVFLSYNANSGLPFVPTYDLKAEVPNAANLVVGNEVRVGGTRVGVIDEITTVRKPGGVTVARLGMKLETAVEPLPRDSALIVRPRSALGLKYVEITKGRSDEGFATGATIPTANARPEPVEIDEFLNTFDDRTRAASQDNLREFGNILVGRGQDLNEAIQELDPLVRDLTPVMRNLGDSDTQLARLFQALGRTSRVVAPIAETQAALFRDLSTTFDAFAAASSDIQRSIDAGPPALETGIRRFPFQRTFLRNNEALFRELRPGVAALDAAAPDLVDALRFGQGSLRRSVALNQRLEPTFRALERFATAPLTKVGINDLRFTATLLRPLAAFVAPHQTVCNYASLLFRNASDLLSDGDSKGTWQRFIIVATGQGPNNEGTLARRPANGPTRDNFLHANNYPNAAAPGQPRECEAGNEGYLAGRQVIGNVPGTQTTKTEETRRDAIAVQRAAQRRRGPA